MAVDFEQLRDAAGHIVVTGDRALDLRVRLKYAKIAADRIEVDTDWRGALHRGAAATPQGETLFILPTYSGAMLELRAVLTGEARCVRTGRVGRLAECRAVVLA
jgi:hypothetical protein